MTLTPAEEQALKQLLGYFLKVGLEKPDEAEKLTLTRLFVRLTGAM